MKCRRINAALKEQVDKLWHTTNIYITEPMLRYAEKLIQTLPKELDVSIESNCAARSLFCVGMLLREQWQ